MRRAVLALFVVMTIFSSPELALAAIPLDMDDQMEDVGQYWPNWFAELQDVEIVGDRAYVFGVGGLAIFDISNPANPLEMGRYEPIGHPYNRYYRGAISGTIACCGAREDLLAIIDISNPNQPQQVALHGNTGQSFEGATIQGNYVFACRHADGLEIVDITTPSSPLSVASVPGLVNSWDVIVAGNTAYVADGAGGLAVVDITNIAAPSLLASLPTSGSAVDVTRDGNTLVVCNGSAGIDIFDLTNPPAPVFIANANTSGLAITAAVADNIVYVADWDDVESFDISNPASPVPQGGEDTPIRAMGLAAKTGLVAVADWSRLRLYTTGPTVRGDIQVSLEALDFGAVPVGATVDTTFTIGNTGGGILTVNQVIDYGDNFTILNGGSFTLAPGESRTIGVQFFHAVAGYDATFIAIDSDDSDESSVTFPVQADDNPSLLSIGEIAPDFNHLDIEGVNQSLSDYVGRVVVMAFFANW